MKRQKRFLPCTTFLVVAAIGAFSLHSTDPMLTRPLLTQEALAAIVPCDPKTTFPKARPASPLSDKTDQSDKAPAVITSDQLVYDLCYAAMIVASTPTPTPSPPTTSPNHAVPNVVPTANPLVEDMMRTIAIEGHLYAVCPHEKPVAEVTAYTDADYLEHHEYGCGPYRATMATAPPSRPKPDSVPNICPPRRPLFPNDASVASYSSQDKGLSTIPSTMLHSSHPPATLAQASFDLCHAALVVPRMSASNVEHYLFRLMMEVHLAQVCSTRRYTALPSDVEPSYTVTREYGCWTPEAPSH